MPMSEVWWMSLVVVVGVPKCLEVTDSLCEKTVGESAFANQMNLRV